MKAEKVNFLSMGVITGFIVGLIFAIHYILANQYFQYEMFRLTVLSLRRLVNKWVLVIFTTYVILIIISFALKLSAKTFRIKNESAFTKSGWIFIICLISFSYLRWFTDNYRWGEKFDLHNNGLIPLGVLSVLADALAVFISALLGMGLIKFKKHKKVRKVIYESSYTKIIVSIISLFLLILNGAVYAYNKINTPKKPSIIIVVVDALRKDHTGIYGYVRNTTPNLDRFSRNAIIIQNAFSQACSTHPSIASLFSSLYPSVHGVAGELDCLSLKITTLAEILKNSGYVTGGFVANEGICNDISFDQGFDTFVLVEDTQRAEKLNKKAIAWLNRNKDRPFFLYLHYMDVHAPYLPPEPYNSFFKSDTEVKMSQYLYSEAKRRCVLTDKAVDDLNYYIDRYDGQIRYLDYQLGEFLQKLKNLNLIDGSIVVLTADHGEAFFEHSHCTHGNSLYAEEINIPLIVKLPESMQIKNIEKYNIQLVDLSATILGILNYNFPYKVNGRNLISIPAGEISKNRAFSENTPSFEIAMIKDNFKAIYNYSLGKVTELYDLRGDKREENNICIDAPDKCCGIEKEIENWRRKRVQEAEKLGIKKAALEIINREKIKKLKSIGYLQ